MSRTLLNVVMLTALSAGESMVKYWRPKEGISLGGGDTVWCHFGGGGTKELQCHDPLCLSVDKDSARGRVVVKKSHIRIGRW